MTGSVGIGNVSDPIAKMAEGCLTSSEDELMMDSTGTEQIIPSCIITIRVPICFVLICR